MLGSGRCACAHVRVHGGAGQGMESGCFHRRPDLHGLHERVDTIRRHEEVLKHLSLGFVHIVAKPHLTNDQREAAEKRSKDVTARLHLWLVKQAKPAAPTGTPFLGCRMSRAWTQLSRCNAAQHADKVRWREGGHVFCVLWWAG
jgi:hypothetical protein